MKIKDMSVDALIPYENNPRNNDGAVEADANSIREFGFKVPIVVDRNGVIVAGHTRMKAAQRLGLKTVPVVVADDLNPEQVQAFRLADNKTAELAEWDFLKVKSELDEIIGIDMSGFGFPEDRSATEWFDKRKRYEDVQEDDDDEYKEFVEKFEAKKTTDDCYTPDNVYDAIADHVAEVYRKDRKNFVRPFYPGGDYKAYKYKATDVVVDNPPFSILSEILDFYCDHGIKFYLFAPALTLFTGWRNKITYIMVGGTITYENGATVSTSFITNMDKYQARTDPALFKIITEEDKKNRAKMHKELPKYEFPDHVLLATMGAKYCKYGVDYRLRWEDCVKISTLDAMDAVGKGLYGGGYLLAERAAAERAAAERAAAERAAAEKWKLSDRELQVIAALGKIAEGEKEE